MSYNITYVKQLIDFQKQIKVNKEKKENQCRNKPSKVCEKNKVRRDDRKAAEEET